MKILWFAVTPSMYGQSGTRHNGGGWIASLEELVREQSAINLGIAFEHSDTCFRSERDGVTYYPINVWESGLQRLKRKLIFKTEEKRIIPACLKVIDDFKPDVIHVFGSEWCFGLVAKYTNIPVVIHMQGSIPPYNNAAFPPGYSRIEQVFFNGLNFRKSLGQAVGLYFEKLRAKREEIILRSCHYFMGRTEWDKRLTRLYSPQSKYFYCSEALRSQFVTEGRIWELKNREKVILVSTINGSFLKGLDVILKTAKLLKENTNLDFEWRLLGPIDMNFSERKLKVKHSDMNIILKGVMTAEKVKEELLNSDMFIHPTYIDNSPNAVCEAQYLGVPVIATYVGGIPSLVKHFETGILFPANDPYILTSYIVTLATDKIIAARLGNNARLVAIERHNPTKIVADLLCIYDELVESALAEK